MAAQANAVTLRRACAADMQRVFAWRNSDFITQRSSSGAGVAWDQHQRWFAERLDNPSSLMLIVEIGGSARGVVRFDQTSAEEATITVFLEQASTGRRAGIAAIKDGCRAATGQLGIGRVVACVREDNAIGLAAFPKAGFARTADRGYCPDAHARFVWSAL